MMVSKHMNLKDEFLFLGGLSFDMIDKYIILPNTVGKFITPA